MKPTFLLSKGQRNKAEGDLCLVDLVEHYRAIAGGLYSWDGLPEGCPRTFIEDSALFYSGGAGAKRVRGMGPVITPIKPATLTIYGMPYEWIPEPLRGMRVLNDTDFFKPSSEPCMWLHASMHAQIEPYLDIMERAMRVLNINIFALSQPIMITGVSGASLGSMTMKSEIIDGNVYIPTTGAGAQPPEVLDLMAEDHTQNLISTIDWCDARILEIMASSNGVEKSSGISTMETVSGVQSIMQQFKAGLELRRDWADRVNDRLKLSLSVEPGAGIEALGGAKPAEAPAEEGEDATERLPLRRFAMPQDGGCGAAHREDGDNAQ